MGDKKEKKQMNTAEFLVQCLEAEGVEYIFGIPGEENIATMEAIRGSKIKFILTRHEQGAAFMADVYGRLTGKAGVCLSTLGPGATNLVTGVADAHSDGAPLVAITGQVSTDRMHITSHQYLDLTKMFEPITKRSKQIMRADSVSEIVRIAFKYAESEKPGASHIDIPADVAEYPVPDGMCPLIKQTIRKEISDLSYVEKAAAEIFKAKRPVILAGSTAVRNGCTKALTEFAEKLRIPVVTTMMAKGIVPADSEYYVGTVGIPYLDYENVVLDDADLIIAVGYDIVEYAPNKWNHGRHKILHIDTSAAHVNKLYQPEVEVVGDISESLGLIANRTGEKDIPEFAISVRKKICDERNAAAGDESFPPKPARIIGAVRNALGKDDIVICDVGAHKMWMARMYDCYSPNTCIISNGFASMGISLPGAIAAKLIYPEKRVIAVCGDGGFMMNNQELETAVRLGVPIVILIFNDSHYGLIKWKQEDKYGTSCYVDFGNPDFIKMAESFGAKGIRVTEDVTPEKALEYAFAQDVPCIIDCPVDYSVNTKLSAALKEMYNEYRSGAAEKEK